MCCSPEYACQHSFESLLFGVSSERLHRLLEQKYYLDVFNQRVFADGAVYLGNGLSTLSEKLLIDGLIVNGVANLTRLGAGVMSRIQTGYLYHYAFAMVIGLALLVAWVFFLASGPAAK